VYKQGGTWPVLLRKAMRRGTWKTAPRRRVIVMKRLT
jgi:hypothetical protein